MNSVFNQFHEFFRNVTSKSRPDETLPFAQVDELNENNEINSCDGSEVDLNEGYNLDERRNTTREIKKPTISAWDAGWNVSNAIQGMFVLGLPISIRDGGFLGVFMIILAAVLCYYTGKILIHCLYEVKNDKTVRVRHSYSEVAVDCWGRFGGHFVNVTQLIELLMTCVLYIVVSANLMKSSFPNLAVSETTWAVLTSFLLVFCVFLRDLKAVSKLSMGCSIAQFVVLGITMFYCLINISQWKWSQLSFNVDMQRFPISIGVIVFSYTSQIFLPTLEGSMKKRKEFPSMLCWSYVASCLTKEFFALFCFLMWAQNTKDVVTDNLPGLLRVAMNSMLVVKAILSYPLPYYQSIEVFEQNIFSNATGSWGSLFRSKRHRYSNFSSESSEDIQTTSLNDASSPTSECGNVENHSTSRKTTKVTLNEDSNSFCGLPSCYSAEGRIQSWALVLRSFLVLGTLIMAVCIPHFALLMGFTGNLTGTLLAFLLPCAFHLQLKRKEMTWYQIALDITIMMFGTVCAVIGLYYSFIGFESIKNPSNIIVPEVSNTTMPNGDWFPNFPDKPQDQN